MDNDFFIQKPFDNFLISLVDSYFYIDIPVNQLKIDQEYVIPFPRITFGYFFNHPYLVSNQTLNQSIKVDMGISRINTNKISVKPASDRVKIIGAHLQPYALSYFTNKSISDFNWYIDPEKIFKGKTKALKQKMNACEKPEEMFKVLEKFLVENLLLKNPIPITKAINIIEKHYGDIKLTKVAENTDVSGRTLRNQFYKFIGCSPKEYLSLVKMKKSIYQMKNSNNSLTDITYDGKYFDQAHFTKTIKRIIGKSPKDIKKEIPDFRFLQF